MAVDGPRSPTVRTTTTSTSRTTTGDGGKANATIHHGRRSERTVERNTVADVRTGPTVAQAERRGSFRAERSVGNENANASIGVRANGQARARIGLTGAEVSASGDVFVGARAGVQGRAGPASGEAELRVGAGARGNASASIGRGGARLEAGGEAFVGARASANGRLSVREGSVGAGVEGYAGVGVTGRASASLSTTNVGFKFKVGAALGIGGSVSVDLSVNPSAIAERAGNVVQDIGSGAKKAFDAITPW